MNRSCRQAWPAIRRDLAAYESNQSPSLSERKRFKRAISGSLIPNVKSHIFDRIMALGAPSGDRSELEEIMRWLGEAIEIGEGQFPIILPSLVWDLFDIYNPLVHRYGLAECMVNSANTGIKG